MKTFRLVAIALSLLLMPAMPLFAQEPDVEALITQTWYSIAVGDPAGTDMFPTKNHEQIILTQDGKAKFTIMHSVMGKMEYMGKWSYSESDEILTFQIEMDGRTESQEIVIRELEESHMILESPDKITKYSTEISEPFIGTADNSAAAAVDPNNSLNLDDWTGIKTFNEAALYEGNEVKETYPSKGQLELIRDGDKLQIKHTENGYVDLYTVNQGSMSIGGKRHYVIVTDEPVLAGGYVFGDDGKVLHYKEQDNTTVEYYMK